VFLSSARAEGLTILVKSSSAMPSALQPCQVQISHAAEA